MKKLLAISILVGVLTSGCTPLLCGMAGVHNDMRPVTDAEVADMKKNHIFVIDLRSKKTKEAMKEIENGKQ